jgi:hypothetical protein
MRRVLKEGCLVLLITLCYLLGIIALRVPFLTIFIIGCALFGIGGFGVIFFKKDLPVKNVLRYIGLVGIMSAVFIWVLVHFMMSKLT